MATSLFYDDNWSDDESLGSLGRSLIENDGYVSLKRLEQPKQSSASWVAEEQATLQRSASTTTAPTLYNLTKKFRNKMNQNDYYTSLFPILDKLILYFPTYILLRSGSKRKHYSILSLCLIFIIWTICEQCITIGSVYFDELESTFNITRGIFYLIFVLNPYIGSMLRFHFFYYKFDWSLWHKKNNKQSRNSSTNYFASYILESNEEFQTRLRKIARMFAIGLLLVTLVKYVFAEMVFWNAFLKQLDMTQTMDETESIIGITFSSIKNMIFIASITIPDILMVIVAKLYFTECCLYAQSFVNEINETQMDDIVDGALIQKYIAMHHKIKEYFGYLNIWIGCLCLQMLLASWHTLSTYLNSFASDETIWIVYSSLEAFIYVSMTLFVLWPVLLMNKELGGLRQILNEKLNHIYKRRLHFHDEKILEHLMNAILQKTYKNTSDDMQWQKLSIDSTQSMVTDTTTMSAYIGMHEDDMDTLYRNLITQSKQECALEILSRLKYLIKRKSCCYELIGIAIDKSTLAHFVIVLIASNILCFVWNSI